MKKILGLVLFVIVLGAALYSFRKKPAPESSNAPVPTEMSKRPVRVESKAISAGLIAELVKLNPYNNDITAATIQEFFEAESLPLAAGQETVLVRGIGLVMCSPTGNCPMYLFQKEQSGYRMILEMESIQQFSVLESSSSGYRDIRVSMHGSATSSDVTVFKFDGMDYKAKECFSQDYSTLDENDREVIRNDPVITPHKCER